MTLIGTFRTRAGAEREALSISEDMPEDMSLALFINDDGTWSLYEEALGSTPDVTGTQVDWVALS